MRRPVELPTAGSNELPGRTARSVRAVSALYRLALRSFPRPFRRRFEDEMRAAFRLDAQRARGRGVAPLTRTTIRACLDAACSGMSERLETKGLKRPSPAGGRPPRLPDTPRRWFSSMDSLAQDVRFAFRTLARNRLFTAMVVFTLALGLGAVATVFSAVKGIVLEPLPFPEPERLVSVWQPSVDDLDGSGAVSPVDLQDWQRMNRSFSALGGLRSWRATLTGVETPESLSAYRLSAEAFRALGVEPALGRSLRPEDDPPSAPPVVILFHGLWERLFAADPDVVGRSIRLNDTDHRVVGVMPPEFRLPFAEDVELIGTYALDPAEYNRGSRFLRAIGRLAPGAGFGQAESDMRRIAASLREQYPDSNRNTGANVTPLHDDVLDGVDRRLWLLMGAVGFVLLMTVINVANLMIGRAASRRGELAIRSALGAGRGRIGRQLLTEALLLAALGGVLGLLLARVGLHYLLAAAPEEIPRLAEVSIDGGVVAFTVLLTLLVGAAFGATPWLAGRLRDAADVLRSRAGTDGGAAGQRSRRALVVLQIATALVLLIGSGLLIASLSRLLNEDPGFDPEGVYAVRVRLGSRYATPETQAAFHSRLLERLRSRPEIAEASAAFLPPFSGGGISSSFTIVGGPEPEPGREPAAAYHHVAPGFLDLLGIPLVAGRDFESTDDLSAEPVALINETAARRYFPEDDPLGAVVRPHISLDDQESDVPRRIVGVVGDMVHRRLDETPAPFVFMPSAQRPTRSMFLMFRPAGDDVSVASAVRSAVDEIDPEVAMQSVRPVSEMIGDTIARDRFAATLLSGFALAALILGCIGIYGVVAYSVNERTGEFGVRMALGASGADIGRMVLRDIGLLALLGLGIGIAASLLLGGVLRGMLHEISPTDPVTFASMAALLLVAALAATAVPARRAARVDPIDSLRSDGA